MGERGWERRAEGLTPPPPTAVSQAAGQGARAHPHLGSQAVCLSVWGTLHHQNTLTEAVPSSWVLWGGRLALVYQSALAVEQVTPQPRGPTQPTYPPRPGVGWAALLILVCVGVEDGGSLTPLGLWGSESSSADLGRGSCVGGRAGCRPS